MTGNEHVQKLGKKHKACLFFRDINALGGQANVAVSMLRSLAQSGFETTLLCRRKVNYNFMRENFGANVRVDRQVVLRPWPSFFRTYYEFSIPRISKFFCGIVINSYTSDILPCADITYVHYPKSILIREKMKSPFWKCYYKAYEVIEASSSFSRSKKVVLANSYFTADAVEKEFHVKPLVLYPPVDLRLFGRGAEKKKENLIVTVSRFSSEKGLEKIPEIAKNVDARFVILGSVFDVESYRKVLRLIRENNVSDRVKVCPDAPTDVKIRLLQQAKIYLHTTPIEHFGISIVEGMGAGCIPIVSDSGGPREFVPDRWRYRNEEDATSKIKSALDSWSPSVGREMRRTASRFRAENFESAFSCILKLYVRGERVVLPSGYGDEGEMSDA